MIQFIRGNFVGRPKWLGGRSMKLEGSDHVPVYMILNDIPDLPEHSTPPLAVRYLLEVHGWQQTIVPFLKKRQLPHPNNHSAMPEIQTADNAASENDGEGPKASNSIHFSFELDQSTSQTLDHRISKEICSESNKPGTSSSDIERHTFLHTMKVPVKRVKCTSYSQLTMRSYFEKSKQNHVESPDLYDNGTDLVKGSLPLVGDYNTEADILGKGLLHLEDQAAASSKSEDRYIALTEWEKIKQKMKTSIPLCKGHGESCVARSMKKEGPNIGRRFYVCARAQGPAANPEANCGHFEWATKRSKSKCKN